MRVPSVEPNGVLARYRYSSFIGSVFRSDSSTCWFARCLFDLYRSAFPSFVHCRFLPSSLSFSLPLRVRLEHFVFVLYLPSARS